MTNPFKPGDEIQNRYTSSSIATVVAVFPAISDGRDMVISWHPASITTLGTSESWHLVPPPTFEAGKKYERALGHGRSHFEVIHVEDGWAFGFATGPSSVRVGSAVPSVGITNWRLIP